MREDEKHFDWNDRPKDHQPPYGMLFELGRSENENSSSESTDEEISENRCASIAAALNPISSLITRRPFETKKRKKIKKLASFDIGFLLGVRGASLSRYLERSCCLARFFCQPNTKFSVFLLYLGQKNKLPTHYSGFLAIRPIELVAGKILKS